MAIPWYVQTEPNPAGSIHATARDLVGWLQFQLGEGAYQGRLLATAANLRETHAPQIPMRMEGLAAAANPDAAPHPLAGRPQRFQRGGIREPQVAGCAEGLARREGHMRVCFNHTLVQLRHFVLAYRVA